MRLFQLSILCFIVVTIFGWSAEDQEIFKVNYELQQDYPGTNFYEFLKLPNGVKSNLKEINKQFRKLSVKYHPDKVKGGKAKKKAAQRNYERLSVIANILKSSTKDRYDFFLKNGFPKYKNNRFLYDRFRPGLIFVFGFLFVVIGVGHYVSLKISASQNRKRVQALIDQIKSFADRQSTNGVLTEQRKIKLEGFEQPFLVRIDGVFIINEEDENSLTRVTTDDIKEPKLKNSLLVTFPVWIWNKSLGKIDNLFIDLSDNDEIIKNDQDNFENSKRKTKKPKGEKLVLPNGKVVYGKKKK